MKWRVIFCQRVLFPISGRRYWVEGKLPGARGPGKAGEGASLQAVGSRHGIAGVSPQKRLNGAAPGGGRMRAVPLFRLLEATPARGD